LILQIKSNKHILSEVLFSYNQNMLCGFRLLKKIIMV